MDVPAMRPASLPKRFAVAFSKISPQVRITDEKTGQVCIIHRSELRGAVEAILSFFGGAA